MTKAFTEKDMGWDRIKEQLEAANGAHVEVDVLSNKGTWESGAPANLADIATWNEFGTSRIDSRPFMRRSFDRNITKINQFKAVTVGKIIDGKIDEKEGLKRLGVFFTGEVKRIFRTGYIKR